MKKFSFILFYILVGIIPQKALSGTSASALDNLGSLEIVSESFSITRQSMGTSGQYVLFSYVDGALATNFDKQGNPQDIYWQAENGVKLSSKVYLTSNTIETNKVRFCIDNNLKVQCSEYVSSPVSTRQIIENTGGIEIDFVDSDNLMVGVQPESYSQSIDGAGVFSFIYQEHLDQNERVLDNTISYFVDEQTLIGKAVTNETSTIKACAMGGFSIGNPTVVSDCSPSYQVDDGVGETALCLYEHAHYNGRSLCYSTKDINKPLKLPADFNDITSSFTIRNGYRVTLVSDYEFGRKTKYRTYYKDEKFVKYLNDKTSMILIEPDDSLACFYENDDFTGKRLCVAPKKAVYDLSDNYIYTFSAMTISPRLTRGYKIKLGKKRGKHHYYGCYRWTRIWHSSSHYNDKAARIWVK
ncbi:hypothetical protein KIT90_15025 [Vibrio sp. B172a]|uniref:hypothetical protein n=1 Tax=Vibrio sp. B172a TaxID=2835790 RepID=UPI0025542541|nr:hypothetical protein [Vibrio sp. B172a]MDK9782692.1 hypothetical protein [Vibrio sp. B172a]